MPRSYDDQKCDPGTRAWDVKCKDCGRAIDENEDVFAGLCYECNLETFALGDE